MKLTALLGVLFFANTHAKAQSTNNNYDSVLAKKLNADAYGMKKYYLVLLKTGPVNIADKVKRDSIFTGHIKNIQWLASQNKLVVAGPFGKNDNNYEGIFILNTYNKKEAEAMIETDTAVHSKVLVAEYYLYYGSASLQQIPELHNKIQQKHF